MTGADAPEQEFGGGVARIGEHAAQAGTATGRHDDVAPVEHLSVPPGATQMLFDAGSGNNTIGDHVVVRRHHLGLGHDRKRREIRKLETFRVYAMQPRRVERRMVDRGAKQSAQRVALMRGDALRRPTEPVEVLR